ncbi:MAG: DUF2793 domain-containing protein [Pseudotabrizicola sp.]|uniref:DUF2793 domain-containing protein n=1 Tax=Pseudotabrizicola sp. TaxID=2939647 RepID=UPI002721F46F|nr:DUF2793 domain-containing protein [Pseudotabrizicola sp.]MDO9639984.1 DUF2793 domain-containing protein [Pseudotabrizicola sp.]
MPDTTPNLAMPYILPAQAQKHVTHNEALQIIDAAAQLCVEAIGQNTPPETAQNGQVWAIGAAPTGLWTGQSGKLAIHAGNGWLFVPAQEGWRAWDRATATLQVRQAGDWAQLPMDQLSGLGIGTGSDAVNRLAVASQASLFSHDGAGHQLKINKAAPIDTASLLFQTGWSGRAEMGLAGNDAFAIKVSADGAAWSEALGTVPATGQLRFPAGALLPGGTAVDPALGFDGDGGTGLFSPAAHQIGLSTGGVARAVVTDTALQLSVPVTGTAVTQSASDTTAGRLLKVGDFGIGASLLLADFTQDIAPGVYTYQEATAVGAPGSGAAFSGSAIVSKATSGGCVIIAARLASGADIRFWHGRRTTATGPVLWTEMLHQARVVGTVAQTAGLPTGAVIERGTNANGNFTRFADGTQICWRDLAAPSLAVTTARGALFTNSSLTVPSFPMAFVGAPLVTLRGGFAASADGWLTMNGSPTTTALTNGVLRAFSAVALTEEFRWGYTAIGRWF